MIKKRGFEKIIVDYIHYRGEHWLKDVLHGLETGEFGYPEDRKAEFFSLKYLYGIEFFTELHTAYPSYLDITESAIKAKIKNCSKQ